MLPRMRVLAGEHNVILLYLHHKNILKSYEHVRLSNVKVAIQLCLPAVFNPVADRLNEYLLNVKGSQHPYYVLEFSWTHPLELFPIAYTD